MRPRHHPPEELVLAYAAGSLGEARSLILATHLALCPACRAEVGRLETLGGALLEELPAAPVDEGLLAAILDRLDTRDGDLAALSGRAAARPSALPPAGACTLPQPLRGYIGGDVGRAAWNRLLPGVEQATVPVGSGSERVRLLRVGPGRSLPPHTHEGTELTLVLSGCYRDGDLDLRRGDFALCDQAVDHRPMAETTGECICLVVTDGPLTLTGPADGLLNSILHL